MTEFEIKLEVPPQRAGAVHAALAPLKPHRDRLRAIYWDVPGRLLERERLALRTRLEGGRWVQTLKGEGRQAMERLEHNVDIGRARGVPRPAAGRHSGSPVGDKLTRVLGGGFDDSLWLPLFETDVERLTATVDDGEAEVEIAFDRGRIACERRETPLCEIEFESKAGDPRAAVDLARRWCAQHGLAVSTISKASKGLRLAKGERAGAAVPARDMADFGDASVRRIAGEALANALDQVMGNASELAAGGNDDEQVHQLRIGIRRARTALRELARMAGTQEEQALVETFRRLGDHRDARHVLAGIVSAPSLPPARIVLAPRFQDAMLSLLALATGLRTDVGRGHARREIRKRLTTLLDKTMADAVDFESVDPVRQHRVRKRLKRLRYLLEFTAPLHPRKPFDAYLRHLKKVQDLLGEYNDDMTALAYFQAGPGAADPGAWFAVGWLEAERAEAAHDCGRRLRKFAKTRPFWR